MRILITGASGLLGINLAMEFAREHTVIGTVNQQRLDPAAVPFQVIHVNLLDEGAVERIVEASHPDWVIHCAALASVDACEADPQRAVQMNTKLPEILANHVAKGGARLLHVSTDCVFDGKKGDYSEEDIPNPLGVYARTKFEAEQRVLQADPDAIIARVNLYGWGITGRRSLAEFFFNHLSERREVRGFTDIFFCPILANDMAGVIGDIFKEKLRGIYHLVGRDSLSKYEFGVVVASRFGFDENLILPTSFREAGLKAARSPNLTLRTDKLSNALGRPMPGLSTGIDHFFELYQMGYPQQLQRLQNH